MKNVAFELISKLIQKTKHQSIKWKNTLSSDSIKPPKSIEFKAYIQNVLLFNKENCYYADYNGGQFFLIFDDMSNDIVLLVQTPSSSYSQMYASTLDESNADIISELKRLYNLVDSIDYDVSTFVDDFIAQD